jgi:transposase
MYIDIVPNRSSPPAILLRESYRDQGKVKKRTLANLSKLPTEIIERIRQALVAPGAAVSEAVCGAIFGVLFVLQAVARQCGLVRVLGSSRMAQLTLFLVLARIAHQGSRLSAVRWARDHAVRAVLGLNGFDEDDLYEALDWVADQQEAIEQRLYQDYVRRVGQPPSLVLYDVTSSYLEGEHNELGEYGYNRDGKKGKKQIVIGLLTAPDGEPLSVEVFRGNTADPQSVGAQVEKLAERFGIKEVVMVGDRGMIKAKGKTALKQAKFKYITALTDPQIRKLIKQSVIQSDLFDEQVVEVEHQDKRLVLRCNPATQRKERHRREDKLAQLKTLVAERNEFVKTSKRAKPEAGLKRLQAWARRYKLSGFVELTLDERTIHWQIDQAAKQAAGLLDGCYCIETDVPASHLSTQQVHDRYQDLQQVERNFRRLKTDFLEVRPIFVRKAKRTRAHVFIAMLSLKIEREIEQRLHAAFGTTDTNTQAETVDSALSALSRLCLQHYQIGAQDVVGLPRPDQRQQDILSALKVTLKAPQKVNAFDL